MAAMTGDAWPEPRNPFAGMGAAFAKPGDGSRIEVVYQGADELPDAFNRRVATLEAERKAALWILVVREGAGRGRR